jgi:hypothetical protein
VQEVQVAVEGSWCEPVAPLACDVGGERGDVDRLKLRPPECRDQVALDDAGVPLDGRALQVLRGGVVVEPAAGERLEANGLELTAAFAPDVGQPVLQRITCPLRS